MRFRRDVLYENNQIGSVNNLPLFSHAIAFSPKPSVDGVCGSIITRQYTKHVTAFAAAGEKYIRFRTKYRKHINKIAGFLSSELGNALMEYKYILNGKVLYINVVILENDKCYAFIDGHFLDLLKSEVPIDVYMRIEKVLLLFQEQLNLLSKYVTISIEAMYNDIIQIEEEKERGFNNTNKEILEIC